MDGRVVDGMFRGFRVRGPLLLMGPLRLGLTRKGKGPWDPGSAAL